MTGRVGFYDADRIGGVFRAAQHGLAVQDPVDLGNEDRSVAHVLIDLEGSPFHPADDVLDIADNGEMIPGGVEQLVQQLPLAGIHPTEKGLVIGRRRSTIDQPDHPGPHAVADRLQQGVDQGVELPLGQDRASNTTSTCSKSSGRWRIASMITAPPREWPCTRMRLVLGRFCRAWIRMQASYSIVPSRYLMGTSQAGVSAVGPLTGIW